MLVGAEERASVAFNMKTPRSVRFFRRVERADIGQLSVVNRPRHKATIPALVVHNAARKFSNVAPVPLVLLVGRFSQIFPSVVCGIAVYVIQSFRLFAGLHNPDEPVRGELTAIHENANMAVTIGKASGFSSLPRVPSPMGGRSFKVLKRARFPDQCASLGIISKALVQISL